MQISQSVDAKRVDCVFAAILEALDADEHPCRVLMRKRNSQTAANARSARLFLEDTNALVEISRSGNLADAVAIEVVAGQEMWILRKYFDRPSVEITVGNQEFVGNHVLDDGKWAVVMTDELITGLQRERVISPKSCLIVPSNSISNAPPVDSELEPATVGA